MKEPNRKAVSRRMVLRGAAGAAVLGATPALVRAPALAGAAPVKVGILLPYSGTYARLGSAITNAMKLYVDQNDGKLGGRAIEFVQIDSEAKPPKAPELTTKLISSHKVDILVGPVHSGVAMGMAKIAREEGTITIIPNAGADQITGALCAPNVFRTSFTNSQPGLACGKPMVEDGIKTAVSCFWNYGAGKQSAGGFKESFEAAGGKVLKEIGVPFPDVEFQSALTEIASIGPDAVYVFFAGGGAVKWVKDYAAAGLKDKVKLYGAGFITEGVTEAQGDAAEGIRSTLHYADTLDNPENVAFRKAYKKAFGNEADVYAVQGYDTSHLMDVGLSAVNGDTGARDDLIAAMAGAKFASPRGPFQLSKAHNPIQNFYLREVQGGVNKVIRIAVEALEDPAKGCKLS